MNLHGSGGYLEINGTRIEIKEWEMKPQPTERRFSPVVEGSFSAAFTVTYNVPLLRFLAWQRMIGEVMGKLKRTAQRSNRQWPPMDSRK